MNDRRVMMQGFSKEIEKLSEEDDFYKEAGIFSASIKSLKGLADIGSTNTGKFFKNIWNAGKEKGFRGALDEASKYKLPEVNINKNMSDEIDIPKEQMQEATLGRGIRHAIGNSADNVRELTKGIGPGKGGFLAQGKQVGKNLKDTVTKQLRGSQYTEKEFTDLDKAKDIVTKDDGKKYLKGKFDWLDREVAQETGRGVLVKKRAPMRAIAPFTTSPGAAGAAASSFMAQSALEPKKPLQDKITTSLKDGGKFIAGDAIGFTSTLL